MKKHVKAIGLLLSVVMIAGMAGCGSSQDDEATTKLNTQEPAKTAEANATEEPVNSADNIYDFTSYHDSSEIPDWTGSKRKLKIWWAHGTESSRSREFPKTDVVADEIERVTGCSIDLDNSFDNGGQDFNVKLGMIAASNDWPDLIVNGNIVSQEDDMIVGDKIWELSGYINQYLPKLMSTYPPDMVDWWDKENRANSNGKIYGIATAVNNSYLADFFPNADPERLANVSRIMDRGGNFGYIQVRDDILKQLYPASKTVDELSDLFVEQNGKFTRDQVYDVTIKSFDDLENLLRGIKDLHIVENGKEIEPFFCLSGEDNWALIAFLNGYLNGAGDCNSYFTYWDNVDKTVKFMYEQDWFKDNLKFYNKLQNEGLASKEALVDNKSIFTSKLNSGAYATSYAWLDPDKAALLSTGATFQYRRVFIDIPVDTSRFVLFNGAPSAHYGINIVKDAVKEEDLPQIMRWIGFNISEAGSKLQEWGPKSANLWTEAADGSRVFTDKALEEDVIYTAGNNRQKELGIGNLLFPGYPSLVNGSDIYSPMYMYNDIRVERSKANDRFRSGLLDPPILTMGTSADVWNFFADVPEIERFWNARPGFEELLIKCIAADSDAQFEKLYADMVDFARTNGMNDEALKKANEVYKNIVNKDFYNLIAK